MPNKHTLRFIPRSSLGAIVRQVFWPYRCIVVLLRCVSGVVSGFRFSRSRSADCHSHSGSQRSSHRITHSSHHSTQHTSAGALAKLPISPGPAGSLPALCPRIPPASCCYLLSAVHWLNCCYGWRVLLLASPSSPSSGLSIVRLSGRPSLSSEHLPEERGDSSEVDETPRTPAREPKGPEEGGSQTGAAGIAGGVSSEGWEIGHCTRLS